MCINFVHEKCVNLALIKTDWFKSWVDLIYPLLEKMRRPQPSPGKNRHGNSRMFLWQIFQNQLFLSVDSEFVIVIAKHSLQLRTTDAGNSWQCCKKGNHAENPLHDSITFLLTMAYPNCAAGRGIMPTRVVSAVAFAAVAQTAGPRIRTSLAPALSSSPSVLAQPAVPATVC